MAIITRNEIARMVAAELGENVTTSELIVEKAFAHIRRCVELGDDVRIHKFGTFKKKDRAARKGRNPQTGAEIDIPAASSVGFKPTKPVKK